MPLLPTISISELKKAPAKALKDSKSPYLVVLNRNKEEMVLLQPQIMQWLREGVEFEDALDYWEELHDEELQKMLKDNSGEHSVRFDEWLKENEPEIYEEVQS